MNMVAMKLTMDGIMDTRDLVVGEMKLNGCWGMSLPSATHLVVLAWYEMVLAMDGYRSGT